ncbi:response regulator transcription factor [Nocardioides sp. AN3]
MSATQERIRVVLVDDHPLVRTGIRALVETTGDITVVAEAADGQAAVDVVATLPEQPDVVLMDLSMPGVDGVTATRRLVDGGTTASVVVLTSFADQVRVAEALEAGAVGYLLKDSEPAALLSGIRAAAAGHAPLDPRVTRALLPARSTVAAEPPPATLSGREREVLGLVAQGLANKQIALRLGISERTVKVHLGNVFRRIGVADRTSAALWARENL